MKKVLLGVVLATVLALAGCSSSGTGNSVSPAGQIVKEINIDSYNWAFTKTPVVINKGDKVRLRLTSSSGTHGVAIPDFGVATGPVSPGQEQVVEFVADKSGSFQYFCNVPCGQGHREMIGQLVVQ